MPTLRNQLKLQRQQRGLSQADLSARAGIARQTLSSLETGASEPSMAVALRLSRALACNVEQLFSLDDERALSVELGSESKVDRGSRVVLGEVCGRWVAHALEPGEVSAFAQRCDGLVENARGKKARVRPLESRAVLEENIILCGCDPALGILASRARREGARFIWIARPSEAALEAAAHGTAHVAGLHLFDEAAGEYNAPFVERAQARSGRAMMLIKLAQVMAGFCVAKGNPLRITKGAHLGRKGLRLVNREPGAGARRLLDRMLAEAGVRGKDLAGYRRIVRGHLQVAQEIASGAADLGVATESAALAHGLSFIPLAEERFDLAIAKELLAEPRIASLLEALQGKAFRRELQSIGGYDASRAGDVVG